MTEKQETRRYIVHERFYVNNLGDIPCPTYDIQCHISSEIIYNAIGSRVLFNVFTMYESVEDALQKTAESLRPEKDTLWRPLCKFTLAPSNISKRKVIATDWVGIHNTQYSHMDIPLPCLNLYVMPSCYKLPHQSVDNDYTSIHTDCIQIYRIAYFNIDYKLYISYHEISYFISDLNLSRGPLYEWVHVYLARFSSFTECEFIKLGRELPYLTKLQLVEMYVKVTKRIPKWYQRYGSIAKTCTRAEITTRYAALLEHARTRHGDHDTVNNSVRHIIYS
jgi:hypothetical protein